MHSQSILTLYHKLTIVPVLFRLTVLELSNAVLREIELQLAQDFERSNLKIPQYVEQKSNEHQKDMGNSITAL